MGPLSRGSKLTVDYAKKHGKPWTHLDLSELNGQKATSALACFVEQHDIRTLNVAGSRGSSHPALFGLVFRIMVAVILGGRQG